jgi:hypothetical protein
MIWRPCVGPASIVQAEVLGSAYRQFFCLAVRGSAVDDNPKSFWFKLGIALGASLATFFFATGMALRKWHSVPSILHHLRDWQTLAVGIVAAILAVGTIFWLERQISESRRQHEDHRERRQFAQNAFLPFALTDLRNYADGCLTALKTFGPLTPPFNRIMLAPGAPLPNVPDIPRQAVDAVIASIESADVNARQAMREALRDLQIQNARLRSSATSMKPTTRLCTRRWLPATVRAESK